MFQLKKQAFTLIELIVTITILAILGTLAFISLQGYQKQARDSVRVTDLSNIRTALELQILETGKHPLPDNSFLVENGFNLIWTQGEFTQNTANRLQSISHAPLDPEYEIPYIYSVDNTKKIYELGTILSDDFEYSSVVSQTHAANTTQAYIDGSYNGYALEDEGKNIVVVPSIILSYTADTDISTLTSAPSELFTMNGVPNSPGNYKNQTETDPSQAFKYQATIFSTYDVDSFIKKIQQSYSGTLFTKRTSYNTINTAVEEAVDEDANDVEVAQMYLASQSLIEQITGQKLSLDICVAGNQVLQTGESTNLYTQEEYPFNYTPVVTTDYITVTCVDGELGMDEIQQTTYTHNSYFNTSPAQCTFNTQNYNHTNQITAYSESNIAWDAIYDCDDRDQTTTCDNGTWSPALNIYTNPVCTKGTPNNCGANPTYNYNLHTYDLAGINHGDQGNDTIQVNENNGIYEYTLTVTCGDGNYSNPSEIKTATPVSCDSGYTIDGNDCLQNCSAGTTSDYTYTTFNHNTTQAINKTIAISNGTRNYTAIATCTDNVVTISNENPNGAGTCNSNFTWNGTIESCEADTQTFTCTSKPDYTTWNSVNNYTQTWNGTSWLPADSTTSYNTTGSTTSCNYQCETNYHTEDNNTCVSDTRSCTITNGSGTQTWNGSSWDTCTLVSCNNGYMPSGNTCISGERILWLRGDSSSNITYDSTNKHNSGVSNSNTTYSSSNKVFGDGSMNFSGGNFSIPASSDWDLGTDDFTLNTWVYFNSLPSGNSYHSLFNRGINNFQMMMASNWYGFNGLWSMGGGYFHDNNLASWQTGQWYHISLERNGSNWTLYKNGVSVATDSTSAGIANSSSSLTIGGYSFESGGGKLNGYMDEFEIISGRAVHQGDFNPYEYYCSQTEYASDPVCTQKCTENGVWCDTIMSSCLDIQNNTPSIDGTDSNDDGIYWIDPDGVGGIDSYKVYCEMHTDGGGWTRVAQTESNLIQQGVRDFFSEPTGGYGVYASSPNVYKDGSLLNFNDYTLSPDLMLKWGSDYVIYDESAITPQDKSSGQSMYRGTDYGQNWYIKVDSLKFGTLAYTTIAHGGGGLEVGGWDNTSNRYEYGPIVRDWNDPGCGNAGTQGSTFGWRRDGCAEIGSQQENGYQRGHPSYIGFGSLYARFD